MQRGAGLPRSRRRCVRGKWSSAIAAEPGMRQSAVVLPASDRDGLGCGSRPPALRVAAPKGTRLRSLGRPRPIQTTPLLPVVVAPPSPATVHGRSWQSSPHRSGRSPPYGGRLGVAVMVFKGARPALGRAPRCRGIIAMSRHETPPDARRRARRVESAHPFHQRGTDQEMMAAEGVRIESGARSLRARTTSHQPDLVGHRRQPPP